LPLAVNTTHHIPVKEAVIPFDESFQYEDKLRIVIVNIKSHIFSNKDQPSK
jgi:hypothetical protein